MNIKLNDYGVKRVMAGHPWVRRQDMGHFKALPPDGQWVRLQDVMGNFLGHAFSEGATGDVAFRVISRERHPSLDKGWFEGVVQAALDKRAARIAAEPQGACRLINGENDGLPGLFCDKFGAYAVMDVLSPGAMAFLPWVEETLFKKLELTGLLRKQRFRDGKKITSKEDVLPELVQGQMPAGRFVIQEGRMKFWVSLTEGAHEGLFLDQRGNRELVASHARGREVLNSFCYTGSFSVACLQAGAVKTVQLDLSKAVLERARENMGLNGLDPLAQEWHPAEAFEKMQAWIKKGRTFGLIIQDPPPFSRNKHGVFQAIRDYSRLAELSLQLSPSGGILALGCGVQGLARSTWDRYLLEAAVKAGVRCRLLSKGVLHEDFPVIEGFPEGDYHKFALLKVEATGVKGEITGL